MHRAGALSCRQVDETGGGIERHRIPAIDTIGRRGNEDRLNPMIRGCGLDRAAGPGSIPRPRWMPSTNGRGKELARLPIKHVEEAVLPGMHDHLACAPANVQVGEHQRLRAIESQFSSGVIWKCQTNSPALPRTARIEAR